jgi:hypothetical protein
MASPLLQGAGSEHDLEATLALVSDDCVFDNTTRAPDGQRFEAGRRQCAGLTISRAGNAPGVAAVGAGRCEPTALCSAGQGRLGAARAVWMSRVSWRVSRTLAGLMREVSRPWQQAMTWSITAV